MVFQRPLRTFAQTRQTSPVPVLHGLLLCIGEGHRGAIPPFGTISFLRSCLSYLEIQLYITKKNPKNAITWKYNCKLPKKPQKCHHSFFPLWYRKGNPLTFHKEVTGSEQCFPSDYKSQCLLLKHSKTDKCSTGN